MADKDLTWLGKLGDLPGCPSLSGLTEAINAGEALDQGELIEMLSAIKANQKYLRLRRRDADGNRVLSRLYWRLSELGIKA